MTALSQISMERTVPGTILQSIHYDVDSGLAITGPVPCSHNQNGRIGFAESSLYKTLYSVGQVQGFVQGCIDVEEELASHGGQVGSGGAHADTRSPWKKNGESRNLAGTDMERRLSVGRRNTWKDG